VSGISNNTSVIPVVNNNNEITIGVELIDGTTIHGQNEISHPPVHLSTVVDKNKVNPLNSPIKRLFYLNQDRQEILPPVNPNVLKKLNSQHTIVYAMGSLYTSIIPALVLRGVGEIIASNCYNKVLILNGYPDRETHGMSATDFIVAITKALNRGTELSNEPSKYITHLLFADGTQIEVNENSIRNSFSITPVRIQSCIKEEKIHYVEAILAKQLHQLSKRTANRPQT